MSVTVDANVLLYASDSSSSRHQAAQRALHELSEDGEILYLFWPAVMAYLRIATHPAIFDRPLEPDAARANIAALTARPNVRMPGEDADFWRLFDAVCSEVPVRGNLVADAHLVALMREYGVATIVTHDRDFRKFENVRVIDPFD